MINTEIQRVRQWIEDRKNYIGGSDVAGILNKSPYATPLKIYHEKIDGVNYEDSRAARRGKLIESLLIKDYQLRFPEDDIKTPEPDEFGLEFTHHEYKFLKGNLDGFNYSQNAVIEVKTAKYKDARKWGMEGSDIVPYEYYLQCMFYMALSGAKQTHLMAGFLESDERIMYVINFNQAIADWVIGNCTKMWKKHIEKKIPPPDSGKPDIKFFYVKEYEYETSTSTVNEIVTRYKELKKQEYNIKKEKEEIADTLKIYIKNKVGIMDDEKKILATWRESATHKFDENLFKIEHEELYKQYLKPQTSRTLSVK